MTPLRILHLPAAVGGHAPQLARAERAIGLDSRCVSVYPSGFAYDVDREIRPGSRLLWEAARAGLVWKAIRFADVVHFNFGRSLYPSPRLSGRDGLTARLVEALLAERDVELLAALGKGIVVTYQGDDVRQATVHSEQTLQTEVPEMYSAVADGARRRAVTRFGRYADTIFFLNPDLAQFLPARAEFLPYASVDLTTWVPRAPRPRGPRLRVVHVPSDARVKGTRFVRASLGDDARIELVVVEHATRADVRAALEQADVVVDQLVAGWYGGLAVEAMALGKPVVAHIREDDLGAVPFELADELPIVRATPLNVGEVVGALAAGRPETLADLGGRSRRFVERWHDPLAIARQLARVYERAAGRVSA